MRFRELVNRAGRVKEGTQAEFKEAVEDAGRAKRKAMGGGRQATG